MYNLPKVSWEEIYEYWRIYSLSGPSILSSPIVPVEIHVECNRNDQYIYGYDWLTHDEFFSRKRLIESDTTQFLYFTKSTNKGTIHTLSMLLDAQSDEERAAIWIGAFAKELLDGKARGKTYMYADQLRNATHSFLSKNFYLWHHAMKRLVPELYMNYTIYLETEFHSVEAVIELARLNAALVLHEYVPILYTSLKPGEIMLDHSVRRRDNSNELP